MDPIAEAIPEREPAGIAVRPSLIARFIAIPGAGHSQIVLGLTIDPVCETVSSSRTQVPT